MTQLTIDDLEKVKDRAVYFSGAFADGLWKLEAENAILRLCKIGEDFTGDDVWEMLKDSDTKTHDPRALGAVFTKLAKDGHIYQTGMYRKSMRKERHRCPMAVWRPVRYKRNTREAQ